MRRRLNKSSVSATVELVWETVPHGRSSGAKAAVSDTKSDTFNKNQRVAYVLCRIYMNDVGIVDHCSENIHYQ